MVVWLVVSIHLKHMSSSVGMMTFPIYGKIKIIFQTTNQGGSVLAPIRAIVFRHDHFETWTMDIFDRLETTENAFRYIKLDWVEASKIGSKLPSGYVKIAIEAMAIEIVDFPLKNSDCP